jgi:hypothetical protein
MTRLSAEKLYTYADVAEKHLEEGHLWLARQILGALEDIAAEDEIGLPQNYYPALEKYHALAADRLLEEYLTSRLEDM